jgi:hypothetical protein
MKTQSSSISSRRDNIGNYIEDGDEGADCLVIGLSYDG